MGHIILPWFHHACDMFSCFVYFVSRIVHATYDVHAFHVPGKYYKLQYGGSCIVFPWFFIHGIRFYISMGVREKAHGPKGPGGNVLKGFYIP